MSSFTVQKSKQISYTQLFYGWNSLDRPPLSIISGSATGWDMPPDARGGKAARRDWENAAGHGKEEEEWETAVAVVGWWMRGGVTPPSFESDDGMPRKPRMAQKMDSPGQNQAGPTAQH
jgi:hypothetical protein